MRSEIGESRFVSNTVALVFQTVAATLLTLLQIKLLAAYLPKETFGLFASLRGLSLLLATLAAHGLPQLLVRFIPVHESRGEGRRAARLAAVSLGWSCAGLVVACAVATAVGSWAFRFVPAPELTADLYVWFYATTLGVMLKLVIYGGLNGLRRLAAQVMLETLSLLAVLVWFFIDRDRLSLTHLFKILGVVNLLTVVLALPVLFGPLRRTPTPESGAGAAPDRDYGAEYKSYLGWAVGLSLVAVAFSDADRYLLAQVLSLELLAAFHIGARVGRLANRLLGVANLAFQPEVTRLDTEGRETRVVQSTRIFLKFNSIFAVSMAAFLVVFARELIILVSSESYVSAVPLLVILALSLPLTTMTAPVTSVMKALDQVRGALWCDLAWAVCYVGLVLALTPPFGLIGVGVAQLAACVVQLVVALKLSRIPIGMREVFRLASKLALCGGASFLPAFIAPVIVNGMGFAAAIAVKAILFAGGALVFRRLTRALKILDGDERNTLTGMLESRRFGLIGRAVGV
jgi:O-antigen/teichoic acid export membrane protein